MAAINGEAEVKVVSVNRTDSDVILIVGIAIVAQHDALHIG